VTKAKAIHAKEPGVLIHELEKAIATQRGIDVALKLSNVMKTEAWKAFRRPYERSERHYDTFLAFVSDGLDMMPEQLRFFCSRTPRILSDLDTLLKRSSGRPSGEIVDNVHSYPRPAGNSKQRALRRLREQRPDLHERVIDGKLSPHAAMIEAGFRRKTASVPIDDLEAIADYLRRHLTAGKLRELVRLLSQAKP
jgi:hypothetical protein